MRSKKYSYELDLCISTAICWILIKSDTCADGLKMYGNKRRNIFYAMLLRFNIRDFQNFLHFRKKIDEILLQGEVIFYCRNKLFSNCFDQGSTGTFNTYYKVVKYSFTTQVKTCLLFITKI